MELLNEFLNSHIREYLGIEERDCFFDGEKIVIVRDDNFSRTEIVYIEDYFEQRPYISDYKIDKKTITIWLT
jgi:hypothetical protein